MIKDFAHLQKKIDETISIIGSDGLIEFLEIVGANQNHEERIVDFILYAVSIYYEIPLEELIKDGNKKDKEPRMIISYLIKEHLNYSVRKIGSICKRKSPNQIHTYLKDMQYYLEKPKLNTSIVANYRIIENQLRQFKNFLENKNIIHDGKVNQEKTSAP